MLAPPTPPACSPTQSLVNFVQFNGVIWGLSNSNCAFTPASAFPYGLFSAWACTPFTHSGASDWTFSPINVFYVNVVGGTGGRVEVKVYRNNANYGHVNYDGIFPVNPFSQWNVLVSVNCLTQVVQVYVNDVPLSPNNAPSWVALENMATQGSGSGAINSFDVGALGGVYPAAANIWWFPSMTEWVDLSVVANRRKFINADLTPVDLGVNGEVPMGEDVPVYLIAKTGAFDIATNYGLAGRPYPGYSTSWIVNLAQSSGETLPKLTLQDPGVCPCPVKGCANYQVVVWSRGGASSGNTVPANFVVSNDSGRTWTKTARTDSLSGDAWGASYVPVNDGVYNEYLLLDTFVNPSYPGFALVATSGAVAERCRISAA